MSKVTIVDTSCLILFMKIGEPAVLQKIFGEIFITPAIEREFGLKLPGWIKVKTPKHNTQQKILNASLDEGEASALALALECDDCLLVIDELKGRKLANHLGIKITGTLGILLYAKQSGQIEAVSPILDKIKNTNFRLSPELILELLKKANEL